MVRGDGAAWDDDFEHATRDDTKHGRTSAPQHRMTRDGTKMAAETAPTRYASLDDAGRTAEAAMGARGAERWACLAIIHPFATLGRTLTTEYELRTLSAEQPYGCGGRLIAQHSSMALLRDHVSALPMAHYRLRVHNPTP